MHTKEDSEKYLITVIIPVYNLEKYIDECLSSVAGSTICDKCQIIIVDDGSADKSEQLIRPYIEKYTNFMYIHKKNGGVSSARNIGLDRAGGTYIAFLDGDDVIESDYLERLYDRITEKNADVLFTGYKRLYDGNDIVLIDRPLLKSDDVTDGVSFLEKRMDMDDWYNQVYLGLYRRAFLQENRLRFAEDIFRYEDIDFIVRLLLKKPTVCTGQVFGYLYRARNDSLVQHEIDEKDISESFKVIEGFVHMYPDCGQAEKHALGRAVLEQVSMSLYYIGEVKNTDSRAYYRRLEKLDVLTIIKDSITTEKDRIKYLMFRINWRWYHGFCRLKQYLKR